MTRQSLAQIIVIFLFLGCSLDKVDNAQSIVDKAIEAHGGKRYENSIIEFDFRNRHYILERNHGYFTYHRIFEDSMGTYHDILDNDGFKRLLNNREVELDAEWTRRYSNSVNGVAYFALLPFGLNDPPVNKELIGEEEINGNKYYKVRVTFSQTGGGEDHDDVFVYWIDKNSFRMDYFGYYYLSEGGGIRFREAINQQEMNGIIFSDYINFKGPEGSDDVAGLAELYKTDQLEKLSEIRIENLSIRRFK